MLDRPKQWPETPDIVIRLRARREAWTFIREEAASEIEKLRANLAIAVSALEYARDLADRQDIENCCIAALAKIKEKTK